MDLKHLEIVTEIARVAHEVVTTYQRTIDLPVQSWRELGIKERQQAQAGVVEALRNPGLTAEMIHRDWLRKRIADGWTFGNEIDEEAKTHPMLVEWQFLTPHGRMKDELFLTVVRALYPQ